MGQTQNSTIIRAKAETIYEAFMNPKAREIWQVPGEMSGKIHQFDGREGGGYIMSLFYPENEQQAKGKTAEKEDRFTSRFVELTPPVRSIEAIRFDTTDPGFSGEMTMEVSFKSISGGTEVTFLFKDIPAAIKPLDNETGTMASLEKLKRYVEGKF